MLHDYLAALLDHAQARRAEALFDFLELNAVFQLLARLVHQHAAVSRGGLPAGMKESWEQTAHAPTR